MQIQVLYYIFIIMFTSKVILKTFVFLTSHLKAKLMFGSTLQNNTFMNKL